MYNELLNEAEKQKIDVYEKEMSKNLKGLCGGDIIWINKNIDGNEKACVLAEELGHYHTSSGDILDQSKLENRKQELRARNWAYSRMVPLDRFIKAYENNVTNLHEFAELSEVTEEFMEEALAYYCRRYGLSTNYKGYTIYFEKLAVLRMFE